MTALRPIALCGFMGAGKSETAKALARIVGCPVADLDEVLAHQHQQDISSIIETHGEAYFRARESAALRDLLDTRAAVIIALGGGAWTHAANRALIKIHDCRSIWLDAPFDLCWQRIKEAQVDRPFARSYSATEKLYAERRSCYAVADLRIAITAGVNPAQAAREILDLLPTIDQPIDQLRLVTSEKP
jgi:shikimate kinase